MSSFADYSVVHESAAIPISADVPMTGSTLGADGVAAI
jgi:hypothetical protein